MTASMIEKSTSQLSTNSIRSLRLQRNRGGNREILEQIAAEYVNNYKSPQVFT